MIQESTSLKYERIPELPSPPTGLVRSGSLQESRRDRAADTRSGEHSREHSGEHSGEAANMRGQQDSFHGLGEAATQPSSPHGLTSITQLLSPPTGLVRSGSLQESRQGRDRAADTPNWVGRANAGEHSGEHSDDRPKQRSQPTLLGTSSNLRGLQVPFLLLYCNWGVTP